MDGKLSLQTGMDVARSLSGRTVADAAERGCTVDDRQTFGSGRKEVEGYPVSSFCCRGGLPMVESRVAPASASLV
jgi:hypothetical protein